MQQETRNELTEIINSFYKKNAKERERANERDALLNSFGFNFELLSHKVIYPTMEEVGKLLTDNGHSYKIRVERTDTPAFRNQKVIGRIALHIRPSPVHRKVIEDHALSYVAFEAIAVRQMLKIQCVVNTYLPDFGGAKHVQSKFSCTKGDTIRELLDQESVAKQICQGLTNLSSG